MIDADVRNAIYQLHLAGVSLRDIGRQFRVSRNTVREIIRQQGAPPRAVRKDKIHVDADLLRAMRRSKASSTTRIWLACGGPASTP